MFRPIVKNIIEANKSIKEANDKQQASELQKTKNEATAKIARQVVHDIKSPLTSLEFLVKSAGKKLVESERLIAKQSIERISDILSTLSIKNSNSEKSEIKEELVDSLIKRIISEKRLEFKSKENVEIELINELPYGSFVNISKSSFLRAISNLVNNSSEAAVDGKNILITIKLEVADDKCRISIMDNGKGIDKEKIFTVFDHGVSYDKELGSGLGLTYAKDTIEKLNGKLSLNSIKGEGTTVLIDLPLVTAPQWFKTSVTISSQYICIIDDDDSIHSIWNELLVNLDVDIKHFKHAAEFERWYLSYGKGLDCLYMFDLELIGSNKNGLDLIEEYNLTNFSTLVTSHYDDNQVQLRALKNNIKIIPKDLVANISIKSSIDSEQGIVLIDDDELVHLSWKLASKKKTLSSLLITQLIALLKIVRTLIKIFLSILTLCQADGVRGDIESKRIYDLGLKIYLRQWYEL